MPQSQTKQQRETEAPNVGDPSAVTLHRVTGSDLASRADEIVAVCQSAFPRWPQFEVAHGPRSFLEWLLSPPAPLASEVDIAVLDGRVVGARSKIERPTMISGRLRSAEAGTWGGIVPEARRKGVWTALAEFGSTGRDFGWAFSDEAVARCVAGRIVDVVRPANRPVRLVRMMTDARKAWPLLVGLKRAVLARDVRYVVARVAQGAQRLRGWLQRRPVPRRPGWAIERVEAFDARVDALWEDAAQNFDFIPFRNADFLPRRRRVACSATWSSPSRRRG
jgi:hypothetical protein